MSVSTSVEELRARAAERHAVTHLLKLGYELSLFDALFIYLLEDGETACVEEGTAPGLGRLDLSEQELPLEEGVRTFLRLRGEMKLGFDYERVGV